MFIFWMIVATITFLWLFSILGWWTVPVLVLVVIAYGVLTAPFD